MSVLLPVLLLAFLGSILGLIGGVTLLLTKKWAKMLECYSIPFAAGVLLTVSLTGVLPEAVEAFGEKAFLVALLAFLGAYIFENFILSIHHHDEHTHGKNYKSSVFLVIFGDSIHNFIDGVAIATAYLISPGLGFITAVSTFLHEVPHEISDFGILLKAGWKKSRVIGVNFLSAAATLFGAVVVLWIQPGADFSGLLLAISAGLFLYLGASDFLPLAHREKHLKPANNVLALIFGVALMLLVINLIPHQHEGGPGRPEPEEQFTLDQQQY